jgi:hypothetical protein
MAPLRVLLPPFQQEEEEGWGCQCVELAGEVWSAVEAWAAEVDWWLTGFWFRACAGETAGESRTPVVAGGVDGGALGVVPLLKALT